MMGISRVFDQAARTWHKAPLRSSIRRRLHGWSVGAERFAREPSRQEYIIAASYVDAVVRKGLMHGVRSAQFTLRIMIIRPNS